MANSLNKELVIRLSKYKRVLQKLKTLGFAKVFSNNLGDAIGVTPALVRKDLSVIKLPGNKRGGYNIDDIIEHLNNLLGKNELQDVIIAGCGKIGTALIQYKEFAKDGIRIIAGFDIDPEGTQPGISIPIYDISEINTYVKNNNIKVAIIAVPDAAAMSLRDQMIEAGIQGILNFAPVELKSCESCVVSNVNLGLEIENLFYLVRMHNSDLHIDS
ncbi:MAG: redox-sensing transcriptional repressor Rex [Spirochaetia bacterium]